MEKDIALFSSIYVRVCGLDLESILLSKKDNLKEIINLFVKTEEDIAVYKEELIVKTERLISHTEDCHLRRILLNLKRDIYNNRALRALEVINSNEKLTSLKITNYIKNKQNLNLCFESIKKEVHLALNKEKELIKFFCSNEILKQGLVLASMPMYHAFCNYTSINIKNKRQLQTERSVLKYLSRAGTKTSPFSTFTTFGKCNIVPKDKNSLISAQKSIGGKLVRLNVQIIDQILIFIKSCKRERLNLFVILNNSIFITKEEYIFFFQEKKTDIFQRLKKNEVINKIYDILSLKRMRLSDIISQLSSILDESKLEIEHFVLNLIHLGFIEYSYNTSKSDYDMFKKDITNYLHNNKISLKIQSLFEMDRIYIESDNSFSKHNILNSAYNLYQDILNDFVLYSDFKIEKKGDIFFLNKVSKGNKKIIGYFFQKVPIKNLFFEDVRQDIIVNLNVNQIENNIKILNQFIKNITPFEYDECGKMSILFDFYKNHYESHPISIIDLYHDFSFWKKTTNIIDKESYYNSKVHWENNFKRIKGNKALYQSTFHISLKDLEAINIEDKDIKRNKSDFKNSYATLAQIYTLKKEKSGEILFSLDTIGSNNGRIQSRFINLFESEVLDEIKSMNNSHKKNNSEIYVENVDTTNINLNLHSPILDKKILLPGLEEEFKEENHVLLRDILVVPDIRNNTLNLYHRDSKQKITIFDMSTQSLRTRTSLYNFINTFSSNQTFSNNSYLSIINKYISYHKNNNTIGAYKIYPRVMLEKRIILQKKRWVLNKKELKIDLNENDNARIFIMYSKVKTQIKLPKYIYVKTSYVNELNEMLFTEPQFININSPTYILYLHYLLKKSLDIIIIEEMLPNNAELFELEGNKHVIEFLFQWTSDGKGK